MVVFKGNKFLLNSMMNLCVPDRLSRSFNVDVGRVDLCFLVKFSPSFIPSSVNSAVLNDESDSIIPASIFDHCFSKN
jgi:hypothetical protein